MLFNSYIFIFCYLPVVLAGFFHLGRINHSYAAAWLGFASVLFYGYWNPAYVGLLLGSISFNYIVGIWIAKAVIRGGKASKKVLLWFAIGADLLLLGYYKYAGFFIQSLDEIAGAGWQVGEIVLPLGISFFTFTQIAFLVDAYQGKVREYNFVHYLLFVTYFPHLIAGPVLHHKEMMPQFSHSSTYRFSYENVSVGLTIFFIGLFKKVILADGIAEHAVKVFESPSELTFIEAWCGALSYTLQLYFDFSAYSDMAIGLSRMFGVVLPLNFHSPYKSVNIIEFWRRWHMTLSRFLRDYLYIPLGGNRKGNFRRYVNLMITMLLGGLWHGAGWTFVLWGGLHGFYLAINHGWHAVCSRYIRVTWKDTPYFFRALSTMLTFCAVVIAWVIFRAETLEHALQILKAMAGFNGIALPETWLLKLGEVGQWLLSIGIPFGATSNLVGAAAIMQILVLLGVVWGTPNTQQIMANFKPVLENISGSGSNTLQWHPTAMYAVLVSLIAFVALSNISKPSVFLYFQF